MTSVFFNEKPICERTKEMTVEQKKEFEEIFNAIVKEVDGIIKINWYELIELQRACDEGSRRSGYIGFRTAILEFLVSKKILSDPRRSKSSLGTWVTLCWSELYNVSPYHTYSGLLISSTDYLSFCTEKDAKDYAKVIGRYHQKKTFVAKISAMIKS